VKSRKLANRQLKEIIDFLLQIEDIQVEDIPIKDVEQIKHLEDLLKPNSQPEMLSDKEINRLGMKPIKVGKIKKEAQ
jgi:hypothetical protein